MPIDESTREAYDSIAREDRDWDEQPDHRHLEWPAVRSLLPDLDGARALDAGCGTGAFSARLIDRGADVVGVDASPEALERARERLPAGRASVHRADLSEPLSFLDDGSFDLVLSQFVLGHVEDWSHAFAEFFRVLRPDGVVVFSAGHPVSGWVNPDEAEDYFETEALTSEWDDLELTVYRRPVSAHLNPLLDAGFRLERYLEPEPSPEFADVDPELYEKRAEVPRWEVVRARKPDAA